MRKINLTKGHKTKSEQMEKYITVLDGKVDYHKIINSQKYIYKYNVIIITVAQFSFEGETR